jgi:hypothetical protein
VFRNGVRRGEGSVFLCRRYVCCTVGYPFRVTCCWPSPALSFLLPSPAGLMTIFVRPLSCRCPPLYESNLTGDSYQQCPQNELADLLEDIYLKTRLPVHSKHDTAPPLFSWYMKIYRYNRFPRRWIDSGGPQHWPPRSPGLIFLCGAHVIPNVPARSGNTRCIAPSHFECCDQYKGQS